LAVAPKIKSANAPESLKPPPPCTGMESRESSGGVVEKRVGRN